MKYYQQNGLYNGKEIIDVTYEVIETRVPFFVRLKTFIYKFIVE